jgi:hypothetical protein
VVSIYGRVCMIRALSWAASLSPTFWYMAVSSPFRPCSMFLAFLSCICCTSMSGFPLTPHHFRFLNSHVYCLCQSRWPRGLRHELSSLIRTLGSLFRMPLEAWMSVCVYSVVLCVGSGLATGWSPILGILPTVYRIKKLKNGQGPTKRTGEQ